MGTVLGASDMAMQADHETELEATRLLKRDDATRGIPVIALTALAMKGDEARIRAAGCDGYIAKPLAYKEFLAIVSDRLATPLAGGHLPYEQ